MPHLGSLIEYRGFLLHIYATSVCASASCHYGNTGKVEPALRTLPPLLSRNERGTESSIEPFAHQ
ncbi:hypothetical protein EMIT0P43_130181 [Pseudomonas jessenii]